MAALPVPISNVHSKTAYIKSFFLAKSALSVAVSDQADQYKTQTGIYMPYGQYIQSLIVAASSFDKQYLLKCARGDHPMHATVMTDPDVTTKTHDTPTADVPTVVHAGSNYHGIDTTIIDPLQGTAYARAPPGSSLSMGQWVHPPPTMAQPTWSIFPDDPIPQRNPTHPVLHALMHRELLLSF